MRTSPRSTDSRPACHWSQITRRTATGRQSVARVWICEYPYRTMRTSPCTDCECCETAKTLFMKDMEGLELME